MSQTNLTAVQRRSAPLRGSTDAKRRAGHAMAKQRAPVRPMEQRLSTTLRELKRMNRDFFNSYKESDGEVHDMNARISIGAFGVAIIVVRDALRKAKRQLRGRTNEKDKQRP